MLYNFHTRKNQPFSWLTFDTAAINEIKKLVGCAPRKPGFDLYNVRLELSEKIK